MIDIEIRTLFYTNTVINILAAAVMWGLWQQTRDRFSGVRCWLSGSLLQLASIVLIALRGQIPDLFSIVLVNALLFA